MLPPATFSSYVSLSSPSTGLVAAAEGCSVIVLTPIKGSGHARLPDGMLKTISEAKEVTGELKYRPSFNFVVRTVPVLLCNNVSFAGLTMRRRRYST